MGGIKTFLEGVFGGAAGVILFTLYISYAVGSIYWLWLAFQLGSFGMFFIGVTPLGLFTGPIGMYAFVFGTPDWIINMFG